MITVELQKIEKIVEREVVKRLRQAFADPDFGLKIRPAFLSRLRKSAASKKSGLKSLAELTK